MTASLLIQFVVSTVLLVLCVVIHGLGLASLSMALRSEASVERMKRITPLSRHGALFTLAIVLAIFILHGVEIWLYAMVYLASGAVTGMEQAIYFSTISYSTVGYNDTHVASGWWLVGAFESILGMILLGWSTAFFFRMLGRIDAH